MKKICALLIAAVCLTFTGCSNSFAREEYGLNEKISENNDRYAEVGWSLTTTNNEVHVKAKSFDGRETLLKMNEEIGCEIPAVIAVNLEKGKVKLVLVDSSGDVTTAAECSAEDGPLLTEVRLSIPKGDNKFKLVGYDCKSLEMQMTLDYDSAVLINE